MRKKRRRTANVITNIILTVAICLFLFSGYNLVVMLLPYYTGGRDYDKVKELAIIETVSPEEEEQEEIESGFKVDFDALKNANADTIAWIRFDEPSIISYPVVKSADNAEYLTQTFTANENKLGAIFMDMNNSSRFVDTNTIIYGHNMKVGDQMFSQLRKYSDMEFCQQYPYFYIYTPDKGEMRYRVFSAGVVKETADNYLIDFHTDDQIEDFIQVCRSSSNYPVDVEVNTDSNIVTLSTCTCVNEDERFIVHGVLEE